LSVQLVAGTEPAVSAASELIVLSLSVASCRPLNAPGPCIADRLMVASEGKAVLPLSPKMPESLRAPDAARELPPGDACAYWPA